MLRYLNGGESHGKGLIAVLEGVPSGLPLTADDINRDLSRRQKGYGRGGRMRIEQDHVEFLSGVRKGKTLGTPITLHVANRDWENWKAVMAPEPGPPVTEKVVTCPRPGHADLVGAIKYNHRDIRNVLEKASARETAIRVAVGGVAKRLLAEFGMRVYSYTVEIGGVQASLEGLTTEQAFQQAEESEVRCPEAKSSALMVERIREAKHKGDTLGGIFEVIVSNPPLGLGSYAQWDRRLTGRLAMALMSIQAMKGVEVGMGFDAARKFGSEVHDEIFYEQKTGFIRGSNNAGGLEGGITNGQPIVLRTAMKPIATLYSPKKSVDIQTKKPLEATIERSDICTVPAAGVVGEAVVAYEIAAALIEKFGGDTLDEMRRNYDSYQAYVKQF